MSALAWMALSLLTFVPGQQEAPAAAKEYWLLSGTEIVVAAEPGFATRGRLDVGVNPASLVWWRPRATPRR